MEEIQTQQSKHARLSYSVPCFDSVRHQSDNNNSQKDMKEHLRADNVCDWEDGMCTYTIPDIKKYINALKTFSSYETEKNKLTIVEHQAIIQEIEAWENILGLIGRIKVC